MTQSLGRRLLRPISLLLLLVLGGISMFQYHFTQTPRDVWRVIGEHLKDLPGTEHHTALRQESRRRCWMHTCFNYTRCSLDSQFPVFFYDPDDFPILPGVPVESFIKKSVDGAINSNPHRTSDPHMACVYVVLLGDVGINPDKQLKLNPAVIQKRLHSLPYWRGDGHNHLLLNLARGPFSRDLFEGVDTGRAILIQSTFTEFQFRPGFDIVIPPSLGVSNGDVWDTIPPLVPAKRKHLISFHGEYQTSEAFQYLIEGKANEAMPQNARLDPEVEEMLEGMPNDTLIRAQQLLKLDHSLVQTLKHIQSLHADGRFLFDFSCGGANSGGVSGEWGLCGSVGSRREVLRSSTFSLIIAPTNDSILSTVLTQTRLYEALHSGAIPVLLGEHVLLPFSEIFSWTNAIVSLPKVHISAVRYVVQSFSENDIFELRRRGRLLWESHFSTTKAIVNSFLALLRTRLHIPALPQKEAPSTNDFNVTFLPTNEKLDKIAEAKLVLGAKDPADSSRSYTQNFTYSKHLFNMPGDPFHSYPFTPFEHVLPADAMYNDLKSEFNKELGGNWPQEQFTILVLTYKRMAVLLDNLKKLQGLPHLNKVVVVWNSPLTLPKDFKWPEIGVSIVVVKGTKNSLNNRFLPYRAIETQAILSLDDDTSLSHDDIILGFRVWRESRRRIVGFPGRSHVWDLKQQTWLYSLDHSCHISMALTGAAFFHKYYAYLYSYVMPQAIRDKVDEYMNCEDIALNFLVSHITREPPIKVTSRLGWVCAKCPKALSLKPNHLSERHKCLNFFVKIYGYMPLLYTVNLFSKCHLNSTQN